MKRFQSIQFRAKDASAQLEALLAEVKPGDLSYELSHHPQKGDAIGLLAKLAEHNDRACELLVLAFPDSQRSVAALIDCVARQTEWASFERYWALQRGFSGQRPVWQREALLLLEAALTQPNGQVSLPLRRQLPAEVKPSGLGTVVRSWFAPRPKVPNDQASPLSHADFRDRYLRPLQKQPQVAAPAGASPVRNRQQRIDDIMLGGNLNPDLFRVLTSREDGYANLKKLIEVRPQALETLQGGEFGQALTLEQFYELWPLLPHSTQDRFGGRLMAQVSKLLSEQQLRQLCECETPGGVSAAVSVLSQRFPDRIRADAELAGRIRRAHPAMLPRLREAFISAIPPDPRELPAYSHSIDGEGPASVMITGERIVVSGPGVLEWFCCRTGQSLFKHVAPDMPRLLFALGSDCYLGQHGPRICHVQATRGKLQIRDSISSMELGYRTIVGCSENRVHLHVYDEDDFVNDDFVFDLSNGHIRKEKGDLKNLSDEETIDSEWLSRRQHCYPNGESYRIAKHHLTDRYFAYPAQSRSSQIQIGFRGPIACGLESYPGGHCWHWWRIPG